MSLENPDYTHLKNHIRYPVLAFLLVIGCLQMVGDVFKLPPIKAFALATQASPAPKVFTAQEGFETYSSQFFLDWTDKEGGSHSLQITPKEYYRGIVGPYNRRNAYGAALSYGPVLFANERTRPMFESVTRYALCHKAPILSELGIDPSTVKGPVTVRLKPRQILPADHTWKLDHEIICP
jgi:hypothetical protein